MAAEISSNQVIKIGEDISTKIGDYVVVQ